MIKNILSVEQFNISNWIKGGGGGNSWQFQNTYDADSKENDARQYGTNDWERIYLSFPVEPNKEYTFKFKFRIKTGGKYWTHGSWGGCIMSPNAPMSETGALRKKSTCIALTDLFPSSASDEYTELSCSFTNTQGYESVYLAFDLADFPDGSWAEYFVKDIEFLTDVQTPSKYLIYSDGTYYTIQDGNLVELQISELSKHVFDDYGLDEVPQFEQISSLTNPSIYTWNAEDEPITTATMKATPLNQSIITNSVDLTHPSITGIEEAYAECEGDLIVAFSFDNKQTWKAWNGTEWALLTEDFTGMDKETLESITFEQWQEVYTGADTMHIRISLIDNTQAVEYVLVDFAN